MVFDIKAVIFDTVVVTDLHKICHARGNRYVQLDLDPLARNVHSG